MSGTLRYGVRFGGPTTVLEELLSTKNGVKRIDLTGLVALCDSDWAGDLDTRRSTRGFVVYYNGTPISSKSKLDTTISLSSAEAELSAMTMLVQELEWIVKLLEEMGETVNLPIAILEDNAACIRMVEEPNSVHSRSKHVVCKKHWVNERIVSGLIKVEWYPTTKMIANIFTKPAAKAELLRFRNALVCRLTELN